MLTLLTFEAGFNEPAHSPFCTKAMALLEMSGQPWRRKDLKMPQKMPYGRLPVLQAGDRLIADSWNIQSYLESLGADFFPGLSSEQKAQAHAVMRMVEEHLRYGLVHDRWVDEGNWPILRDVAFRSLPMPLSAIIPKAVRKRITAGLMFTGIAQFTPEDQMARLGADLDCLAGILGDKPFLFGDRPCAADASAVPVLSMLRGLPARTMLRDAVAQNAALSAYVDRGREAFYPEENAALAA